MSASQGSQPALAGREHDRTRTVRIIPPPGSGTTEYVTRETASKRPTKEIVLAGTLDAIVEVGQREIRGSNGVLGPGHSSWPTGAEPYTKIRIRDAGEDSLVEYKGIILPDSVGNPIILYREVQYFPVSMGRASAMYDVEPYTVRHGKHIIHDIKLDRWYL